MLKSSSEQSSGSWFVLELPPLLLPARPEDDCCFPDWLDAESDGERPVVGGLLGFLRMRQAQSEQMFVGTLGRPARLDALLAADLSAAFFGGPGCAKSDTAAPSPCDRTLVPARQGGGGSMRARGAPVPVDWRCHWLEIAAKR